MRFFMILPEMFATLKLIFTGAMSVCIAHRNWVLMLLFGVAAIVSGALVRRLGKDFFTERGIVFSRIADLLGVLIVVFVIAGMV